MSTLQTQQSSPPVTRSGSAPENQQRSTPAQLVDAINGAFGRHPHARALHAKGIVLDGTFTPSAAARTLSRAPHLQCADVPVTVRFSNFNPTPGSPDLDPTHGPRGMALRFHLPDGSATDLVTHSYNGFPTSTADEFRQLFLALGASGPGVPSPTPAAQFLASHPAAKAFLEAPNPMPVSYGALRYFGVNSFKLTNAEGRATFGRYRIEPAQGEHFLSSEEQGRAGADYLQDEILARGAHGPISFTLCLQIAEEMDKLEDPSVAWPEIRAVVALGVITLTSVVADAEAADRALLFSPGALPPGIEPADPMILARSKAYLVSYERRQE